MYITNDPLGSQKSYLSVRVGSRFLSDLVPKTFSFAFYTDLGLTSANWAHLEIILKISFGMNPLSLAQNKRNQFATQWIM